MEKLSGEFACRGHRPRSRSFSEGSRSLSKVASYCDSWVTGLVSGLFRISATRGDAPLASTVVDVVPGAGPLPRKTSISVPQMISLGALCRSFLTGRKHGNPATRILQFTSYKAYKKKCKNYTKIHGRTKGVAPPPPLNTSLGLVELGFSTLANEIHKFQSSKRRCL